MKKLLLLSVLFALNGAPVTAQEADTLKVYDVTERMPSFPGGQAALYQYIHSNLNHDLAKDYVERIIMTFTVEKDGTLSDIKSAQYCDCDDEEGYYKNLIREAKRVLQSMPRWKPGRQNCRPVRVKYTLPVTFRKD